MFCYGRFDRSHHGLGFGLGRLTALSFNVRTTGLGLMRRGEVRWDEKATDLVDGFTHIGSLGGWSRAMLVEGGQIDDDGDGMRKTELERRSESFRKLERGRTFS